ncbi:universal stress protein [Catelliglobosispora koreensis]|uniref:universal stress protein n=1 Tax=Catelliglobosispora koreensis TaxID=129052 RepID=UPI00035F1A12|nr:universal stress protein [Catelliglobosispora koreensis]
MQQTLAGPAVVAGFDGSFESRWALRWAASEARRRNLPLHAVHVVQWPTSVLPMPLDWLSGDLQELLRKDMEDTAAANDGPAPEVSIVEGSVVGRLCELSQGAAMLVVGAHGEAGLSGQLIGSVAFSAAANASCPVVVIRGHYELPDASKLPIVAGIDGVENGARVLEFALAAGAARQCAVLAVRACAPAGQSHIGDDDHRMLEQVVAIHRATYPSVEMWAQADEGAPSEVLIALSKSAQLVVAGAHGEGGSGGPLLGAVSQQLLQHASCPVAIVR